MTDSMKLALAAMSALTAREQNSLLIATKKCIADAASVHTFKPGEFVRSTQFETENTVAGRIMSVKAKCVFVRDVMGKDHRNYASLVAPIVIDFSADEPVKPTMFLAEQENPNFLPF